MNDLKKSTLESKKLSLKQALFTILLSVCFISGSSFLALIYYQHIRDKQKTDSSYQIVAIVQTSPDAEGLKTGYLAELLDLSIDRPKNLYSFNSDEATQKLLSLPVIKNATIRKIRPGTIHVDYTLRRPIAYLADYSNTAIDITGKIFPFKPFYTPKKLPEIYLGEEEGTAAFSWGEVVTGKRKELAFILLGLSTQYCDEFSSLSCIDVSNAFASSDGQRQIVMLLEDRLPRVVDGQTVLCIYPRILRLRPDNYKQQLGNYLILRSYLREQDRLSPPPAQGTVQKAKATIIDLRLSELAFFAVET